MSRKPKQHWWVRFSRLISAFFVIIYGAQIVYKHFVPDATFIEIPITLVYFSFVILSGDILAGYLLGSGTKSVQLGNLQVDFKETKEESEDDQP
jgi:hypothetical protein